MLQGIDDGQVFFTGDTENIMDAFFFQAFDEKLCRIAHLFLYHSENTPLKLMDKLKLLL